MAWLTEVGFGPSAAHTPYPTPLSGKSGSSQPCLLHYCDCAQFQFLKSRQCSETGGFVVTLTLILVYFVWVWSGDRFTLGLFPQREGQQEAECGRNSPWSGRRVRIRGRPGKLKAET